jgi:hypothetical protein
MTLALDRKTGVAMTVACWTAALWGVDIDRYAAPPRACDYFGHAESVA